MKGVIKNLISFILPATVLVIIPFWIEKDKGIASLLALLMGIVFIIIGLSIMVLTISSLIKTGKGTLAPWYPTKKLVVHGIYKHVRNPMIIGVIIILTGESIVLLSFRIFIWACLFFIINTLHFILYEEPDLERKFGDEYREYKKCVPRWIPKLK